MEFRTDIKDEVNEDWMRGLSKEARDAFRQADAEYAERVRQLKIKYNVENDDETAVNGPVADFLVNELSTVLSGMVAALNPLDTVDYTPQAESPQTPNSYLSTGVAEKDEDGGDSPQSPHQPQISDYR